MERITANRATSLLLSFVRSRKAGTYLVPANVCECVPQAFQQAGVPIRFVDIDPVSLCMDKRRCLEMIAADSAIVGVLYVRTYGYLVDEDAFFEDLRSRGVAVIDDRCLCLPEEVADRVADMTLYSTGYAKQVDLGTGGFCLVRGGGFHLADCEGVAPLQIPQEEYFEKVRTHAGVVADHKRMLNGIYRANIPEELQFDDSFNGWRFNIRVPAGKKQSVIDALFAGGLFASGHYRTVASQYGQDGFPFSDRLYGEVVNLFNDFYFTQDQARETCRIIKAVLNYE